MEEVSDELNVPDHIEKPNYYYEYCEPGITSGTIEIKTNDQILYMRDSCKVAANILKNCQNYIKVIICF